MPEWLEADGTGGFASGAADTIRTRRYHAILLAQTGTGRYVLVNGLEAWLDLPTGPIPITSQNYEPGVIHPDGASRITAFTITPWPTWTHALPDGTTLTQELLVAGGQTSLRWTRAPSETPARLNVRLLVSGRDYHALHHENPAFDFTAEPGPGFTRWRPYLGLPPITAWGGDYREDPIWFRHFLYVEERSRGLDHIEDLASPGILSWDLVRPATLALRADTAPAWPVKVIAEAQAAARLPIPPLHHAASQYLARRSDRATILAGFPWFTDWGRDTFISIRGLLLTPVPPVNTTRERLAREAQSQSRRDLAEQILLAWSEHVHQGMLPNRFPDGDGPPEYNSVDASLWFIIAVHHLLEPGASPQTTNRLQSACTAILEGYSNGTRYDIAPDADGLLHAGIPGVQLTWMDAKVNNWVVTPRIGKPVEIQALWINALRIASSWTQNWAPLATKATLAFQSRFHDPATGGLHDLIDGDPTESRRVRPNQVFAVGGLPHTVVLPDQARAIVDLVEARLLTPIGLRTLDPADPAYRPRYTGGVLERDGAYHQGTVWPWLIGPFVEAWLRVRGYTENAKQEARTRFLPPLQDHLTQYGLGHISEVADGDPPHHPGGCPFQAWSLGELLRIEALLQP